MGYRYNLNDRDLGGSMEPRLNPEFGGERLGTRQPRPSPLVRETSHSGCVRETMGGQRRRLIGLPPKFDRES